MKKKSECIKMGMQRGERNMDHTKEIEIEGCVEVPIELTMDEFMDKFIAFIEENGWYFGGGMNEIVDGFYINPDGSKGEAVF